MNRTKNIFLALCTTLVLCATALWPSGATNSLDYAGLQELHQNSVTIQDMVGKAPEDLQKKLSFLSEEVAPAYEALLEKVCSASVIKNCPTLVNLSPLKELITLQNARSLSQCTALDLALISYLTEYLQLTQTLTLIVEQELIQKVAAALLTNPQFFSTKDGQFVSQILTSNASKRDYWQALPLCRRTFKHNNWVRSAVFSPDGSKVLTASYDNTAQLWDASTGQPLRTFQHNFSVNSATFNPDGTKILTTSHDTTAQLWDASTGKLLHTLQHTNSVLSATFSPDGTKVLTASYDYTAKLWDASTGQPLQTFQHNGSVYSATFNPDGNKVLTASWDDTAKLFDASTGLPLQTFQHNRQARSATFSPDGTKILTASSNHTATLWDASTGQLLHTFQHNNCVYSATFNPDGTKVLTASSDHTATLWDASTGQLLRTFHHNGWVNSATFSPDGSKVLTASDDKTAKLCDASTGLCLQTFQHNDAVRSATFSPDGTKVLTASHDTTAQLWQLSIPQTTLKQRCLLALFDQAKATNSRLKVANFDKRFKKIFVSLPLHVVCAYRDARVLT